MPKKYRCLRGVSVRKSADASSPQFEEFVDYAAGDVIDLATAPKHINIKFLIEGDDPAVEEIPGGEAVK